MELECGYSPKQTQSCLFWLPCTSTGPATSLLEIYPWERTLQWDALASSPILQTLIINYYTHTHTYALTSPPPIPRFYRFWTASLTGGSVASAENGCGSGRLPAGAGLLPLLQRVSMVYVLLLRCFSCSHTVLPKEHSLGVIFFLLTFLLLCCNFSSIPCLPVLSTPLSYMYVMYGQVEGLFHWYLWLSDNKGLLLLILINYIFLLYG